MMRLKWTRTFLAALGFIWVMAAWHYHESVQNREAAYIRQLISKYCSESRPTGNDKDVCEINFRSRTLGGGGVTVSGSVDVDGSVTLH